MGLGLCAVTVQYGFTAVLYGSCTIPSMAWMCLSMAIHDMAVCHIGLYKNGRYGCMMLHLSPTNPLPLT